MEEDMQPSTDVVDVGACEDPLAGLPARLPSKSEPYTISNNEHVVFLVDQWWRAWASKDMKKIDEMTSNRYLEISKRGRPMMAGKTALLECARDFFEGVTITKWKLKDPISRIHGRDLEVCSYHLKISGAFGLWKFEYEGDVTDVLIYEEEHWRCLIRCGEFHPNQLMQFASKYQAKTQH
jgi:hypothetical protein